MRAKVAKRLRRMVQLMPATAWTKEYNLIHKSGDRGKKDYRTAVLAPDCARYHYQQLKKEYYQERRHA